VVRLFFWRILFAKIPEELFAAAGVDGGVVDHVVEAFYGVFFLGFIRDVFEEEADLRDIAVAEQEEALGGFAITAGAAGS